MAVKNGEVSQEYVINPCTLPEPTPMNTFAWHAAIKSTIRVRRQGIHIPLVDNIQRDEVILKQLFVAITIFFEIFKLVFHTQHSYCCVGMLNASLHKMILGGPCSAPRYPLFSKRKAIRDLITSSNVILFSLEKSEYSISFFAYGGE